MQPKNDEIKVDINKTYNEDCRDTIKRFPDGFINCSVSSPPYFRLRDYKVDGQIGLEKTPDEFIARIVGVYRDLWPKLRDDGTVWINIADSWWQNGKWKDIKRKEMIGIPFMLAFAMRADGWYWRDTIIWHKPNAMPESANDRTTKAHEYILIFSKKPKYYFDAAAIKTEYAPKTLTTYGSAIKGYGDGTGLVMAENRAKSMKTRKPKEWPGRNPREGVDVKGGNQGSVSGIPAISKKRGHERPHSGFNAKWDHMSVEEQRANGANKRSVWTVAVKPSPEKGHFAAYPPELIIDCIKAGCPPGGIVYDPFHGTGTTGEVALRLERNFVASELNPDYCRSSNRRTNKFIGLFTENQKPI